jgi:hypothetical protein
MRDAIHVQPFRVDSTPMDREMVINQSAAKEVAARKKGVSSAAKAPAPRPQAKTSVAPQASSSSNASHLPSRVAQLQFIHYPGYTP